MRLALSILGAVGRLRFRYRVRSLLLCVTTIGAALGWLANRAHMQKQAVATVERVAGVLYYDYEVAGVGMNHGYYDIVPRRGWWWPSWVERTIIADVLSHVTVVDLSSTEVTDEDVTQLLVLHRLRYLGLGGTKVTNQSVPVIQRMTRLELLELTPTRLTKEDIADIQRALPGCEILSWTMPD